VNVNCYPRIGFHVPVATHFNNLSLGSFCVEVNWNWQTVIAGETQS